MQVCVLGATGFIGGHIARAAHEHGWQVRATRRRASVGAIGDVPVEWVQADLNDVPALSNAMRNCSVVFHAAASYPQDFRHIATAIAQGQAEMQHVLDAARNAGVPRLIYTSSLSTTSAVPGDVASDERTFYQPGSLRSAYYEAKFAMEQLALQAATQGAIAVIALLPTAVFGPGDVKPTTGIVIREAAQGRMPIYFDATINAVDARDVARSHIAAVEGGQNGQRYLLGGHNIALYDFLTTVAHVVGRPPPRLKLSRNALKWLLAVADALPFVNVPENFRTFERWQPINDAKARRDLGHTSRPLEETIRDTVHWFNSSAHQAHP